MGATFSFFLFAKKLTVTFREGVILQLVKVCIKKNCAEKTKRGKEKEKEKKRRKKKKEKREREREREIEREKRLEKRPDRYVKIIMARRRKI